eukprot:352058-Chlamydomonas_euryale.AAC.2
MLARLCTEAYFKSVTHNDLSSSARLAWMLGWPCPDCWQDILQLPSGYHPTGASSAIDSLMPVSTGMWYDASPTCT